MFEKGWTPPLLIAAAAGLAAAFFIGDVLLPLGVAGGVPYVAVVGIGWWLPWRRHVFLLALVSTVLILAGYLYSPPGGVPWAVVANRLLAVLAVWVTAALLIAIRREKWARRQSQAQANVSENRLIDALESIEDGVALYDSDDRFVFCNTKYKDNLSVIKHMFVPGTPFEDILRAVTKARFVTGAADDPEKYIQDRMERRRNLEPSLLHIAETDQLVMLKEYRTSDGGTLIVRTDITEIKRAEKKLRESEGRFRAVIDSVPSSIVIKGLDHRRLIVNKTFSRWFNAESEASLGTRQMENFDQKTVDLIFAHERMVAETGKIIEQERTVTHPDGITRDMFVQKFPIRDEDGQIIAVGSMASDVTQRKQVEVELLESEKRFRDLAETASDWFWEADAEHRYTYVSERYFEITGRSTSDVMGKTRAETVDQRVFQEEREVWQKHLDDMEARRPFSNFIMSRPGPAGGPYEGRRYFVRMAGRPHFSKDGEFLGYRGTSTDITPQMEAENALRQARDDLEQRVEERTRELSDEVEERKRIEADLRLAKETAEYSDRTKSEFLANMSHELRTPLNSIIGFSDMLLSEIYGAIENQRYLEYLGDINASGRHLLDLINDILDVSKIEAGAMDMADEEVKIAAAADACLSMVKERAVRAGVSLECNIPADLPSVRGDALRIKQVLLNLIGNAIKFTPSGGHVMVTAGLRDGGVFVTISDTGIGIAEEDLKRVTEPFSQAAKGMTRNYEGTGLGLTLVKSMMALHEGKFSIESVLSQGTEVTIQFPKHRTILPDQIKTTA